MTIIGRYIFRQAFGAILLILGSLTVVIWLAVALRQLEFMASQGQTVGLFLQLTGLALPSLITFIAPVALLIAVVHTLNRLNGDSELIVTTAGGASTWRLAAPLMLLAAIVSVGVSAANHVLAPAASRKLRDLALQARTDLMSQALQPGRFTAAEPRLTIHIRERAPDGTLLGLLVHDARDEKQINSYLADRGTIVKQGEAAYLVMEGGHILRQQAVGAAPDVVAFERYAVDVNRFEQKADAGFVLRPRERPTTELLSPDPKDPVWINAPGRYRSELHDRFATALYPFAYVLLALACVGQAQTTRQNRTTGVVLAIAVGFAVRMLGINAATQAVGRPSAVGIMYAVPVVVALVSALIVSANLRPRAAWSWPRRRRAANA